jgi:two-component system cell cycle sensor histidine kinase/response regulator CckA
MGFALVRVPYVSRFPGVPFVTAGLVFAYFVGPVVGIAALFEILLVAGAAGSTREGYSSPLSLTVAMLVAAAASTLFSLAFAREREARRAAVESEDRYRSLLETAFETVVLSVEGVIVEVNHGFELLTGVPREELIGHRVVDFVEPESKEMLADHITSGPSGSIELVVSVGGRRGRIVRVVSQNVSYRGKSARLLAIEDVTDRRDAEEERTAAEARYRALFESAGVAVTISGIDGVYLEANSAFCSLVGRPRDEVVGHHFAEFAGPLETGDVDVLDAILRGEDGPFNFEGRLVNAAGARIPVRVNVTLVRDEQGDPLYTVTVLESIAEQRRLEDQIRQAQKMEAIGQLAGGIAHDFNNLLTVIGGNVMLLTSGELSAEAREYAGEIAGAAERAGAMTRQLLTFSRNQELRLANVRLNDVARGVLQLLQRLLGPSVEIELRLDPNLDHVLADAGQLEQVLINLAVNARQAMPDGGRLTIATERDGGSVALRVTDTGMGMDDATRERVFEPFFTTKVAGEGTGLGLSTVYGIVRQSGGDIRVESTLGEGATFIVSLPAVVVEPSADTASALPPPPRVPRAGRVMLVDDEAGVRKVAGRALSRAGHDLVLAGSGQEALDLLDDEDTIDLLITDLAMPGMNGLELAERVHALHPSMPVLYISGYADQVLASVRPSDGSFDVLEKPFTPAALTDRVAQVLADRD